MKKFYISVVAIAALTLGLNSSCTEDFDEINTNPDAYTTAPATNMLANSLYAMSVQWGDEKSRLSDWAGYLVASYENETFSYLPSYNEFGNKWYTTYTQNTQLKEILSRPESEVGKNMRNVATTLQQFMFFLTADCYGSIPYSEAGLATEGNLAPKYDTDEEVYAGIEAKLKEVSESWAEGLGADGLGSGDLLYGGDVEMWQRFCNSLRLRLAMRLSNMSSHLEASKATFQTILSNPDKYPVIETSDQNAYFMWEGSASYRERWYDNFTTRPVDYVMPQVFVDRLKSQDDPRLYAICRPAVNTGEYRGVLHGSNAQYNGEAIDNYSFPTALYMAQDATENAAFPGFSPYFRAAETWFLIAEAAYKGWSTGSYSQKEAYENGVLCSMEDNGVADSDAEAYIAGKGKYTGSLEQIYLEEWVALYKQCQEAWCLYRRTGYPTQLFDEVTYSDGGTAPQYPGQHSAWGFGPSARHNDLPWRFPYPENEYTYNPDNLAAAAEGITDYCWGKRICWAKDNGRH